MKVYLGGQLTVTRDNACIFYIPGNPQHYQAVRKFRNSYVHFSCGENLAKRFGLPCNEIFYPSDCQEIDHCIQKLQHEYLNREVFSRDYEYALLCQLMITASRELRSTDTSKSSDSELCSLFQKIRLEMLTNYEKPWTTEKLCAMANLEKSQFYSCYRNFFDSTPHADLNLLRLKKPKICSPTKLCLFNRWLCCADFQISPTSAGTSERTVAVRPVSGHAAPDQKDIHTLHSLRRQLV